MLPLLFYFCRKKFREINSSLMKYFDLTEKLMRCCSRFLIFPTRIPLSCRIFRENSSQFSLILLNTLISRKIVEEKNSVYFHTVWSTYHKLGWFCCGCRTRGQPFEAWVQWAKCIESWCQYFENEGGLSWDQFDLHKPIL